MQTDAWKADANNTETRGQLLAPFVRLAVAIILASYFGRIPNARLTHNDSAHLCCPIALQQAAIAVCYDCYKI